MFEREGLLEISPGRKPRALKLLVETGQRQQQVGTGLYDYYDQNRRELIHLLTRTPFEKPLEQAIRTAQKIIDRIIFVAFCEDRGLLPDNSIHRAYSQLPAFARVTNPRWQNFLQLFESVDKGNKDYGINAFNGGLFAHDDDVDDLKLDDRNTDFFDQIANYSFRDEVNVEVLGHLFEKSVNDIERIRLGGLFDAEYEAGEAPKMEKSAERKRSGIYYTPPEFTGFIVRQTIGKLIEERFAAIAAKHKLKDGKPNDREPDAKAAAYWRDVSAKWRSEQEQVGSQIERYQSANREYVDTALEILELAERAYPLYVSQNGQEKRKLLNSVLSNCTFDGITLYPTYKNPFDLIAEGVILRSKLPRLDSNQRPADK
ncbi:MAG TPA: hypothetical protein VMS71_03105 [Candidatus Acidoferrum sp.]|nr:hypothetical protein [Candidatus Acidoferrum sp.]